MKTDEKTGLQQFEEPAESHAFWEKLWLDVSNLIKERTQNLHPTQRWLVIGRVINALAVCHYRPMFMDQAVTEKVQTPSEATNG